MHDHVSILSILSWSSWSDGSLPACKGGPDDQPPMIPLNFVLSLKESTIVPPRYTRIGLIRHWYIWSMFDFRKGWGSKTSAPSCTAPHDKLRSVASGQGSVAQQCPSIHVHCIYTKPWTILDLIDLDCIFVLGQMQGNCSLPPIGSCCSSPQCLHKQCVMWIWFWNGSQ